MWIPREVPCSAIFSLKMCWPSQVRRLSRGCASCRRACSKRSAADTMQTPQCEEKGAGRYQTWPTDVQIWAARQWCRVRHKQRPPVDPSSPPAYDFFLDAWVKKFPGTVAPSNTNLNRWVTSLSTVETPCFFCSLDLSCTVCATCNSACHIECLKLPTTGAGEKRYLPSEDAAPDLRASAAATGGGTGRGTAPTRLDLPAREARAELRDEEQAWKCPECVL
jgi:hypothetical protein